MEMHQIRYFLAVAQTLNFTKAAEQCHVTQPALSRAIQQLESEVGGLLLRRERTLTHLTDLGRLMRPYLEQILRQAEEAKQQAKGFLTLDRAELRLGVLNSIGPLNFTSFLGNFHHRHPGIRLVITEGSPQRLIELMQQGELEVAIMAQPVDYPARFDAEALYSERFMVAFPPGHEFAKLNGIRPADMNGQAYVRRLSCEYRAYIADALTGNGARLEITYQSEREDWVQTMIMAGLGVTSMPEYSPVLPGLMTRPYVKPEITRTVSLVSVAGRRHSPALATFMKAVRSFAWPQPR